MSPLCFLLLQPAGPCPPSPRWLSSTILVLLSIIAAAALAGYLSLTPRRRSPWVNIRVKGMFFTPVWTSPWDSSPGRTLPIPLVSPVTNDSVTLVLFTFCSSGLEEASVEN